jgi:hypothetical protein
VSIVKTTATEKETLDTLCNSGKNITMALPEDLDSVQTVKLLKAVSSLIGKVDASGTQLRAILGRLLVIVKANPEIYKSLKYETYSEFLTKEVVGKYRISRSTLYEAKKIAECFPDLPVSRYQKLSCGSLLLLTKFTSQADNGSTKLLEKAEEMSYQDFREHVIEKGYLSSGDTVGATLSIKGSVRKINELKKFLKRPEIQAHVESADPLEILLAASREVDNEWTVQGNKILESKAEESPEEEEVETEE